MMSVSCKPLVGTCWSFEPMTANRQQSHQKFGADAHIRIAALNPSISDSCQTPWQKLPDTGC